jgi:Ca2+/Na+ antiporter
MISFFCLILFGAIIALIFTVVLYKRLKKTKGKELKDDNTGQAEKQVDASARVSLILVSVGVGMIILAIAGMVEAFTHAKPPTQRDLMHLLSIASTGVIGLASILISTRKPLKGDYHNWPGLWLVTNLSVGLVFAAVGFTVILMFDQYKRSLKTPYSETIESFKRVAEDELPRDLAKLNDAASEIRATFERHKQVVEEVEAKYGKMEQEKRKFLLAYEEISHKQFLRSVVVGIVSLVLGVILKSYVDTAIRGMRKRR